MRYWSSVFSVLSVVAVLFSIAATKGVPAEDPQMYFFSVGQGDSALIVLPEDVRILVDGGPGTDVLDALSRYLPFHDRTIDIVILTHPEKDHYGGLIPVCEKYAVRMILYNGRTGEGEGWRTFEETVQERHIPTLPVAYGDEVRFEDYVLRFLWPLADQEGTGNEVAVVFELEGKGLQALFTSDVGFSSENAIVQAIDADIDILKVAHHGSAHSTGTYFLQEATPYVSVISVGKNSYGHPSNAVIERLHSTGSEVYRTDKDGDVHVIFQNGILNVLSTHR